MVLIDAVLVSHEMAGVVKRLLRIDETRGDGKDNEERFSLVSATNDLLNLKQLDGALYNKPNRKALFKKWTNAPSRKPDSAQLRNSPRTGSTRSTKSSLKPGTPTRIEQMQKCRESSPQLEPQKCWGLNWPVCFLRGLLKFGSEHM
ncbi:hypothetical protein PC116_g6310 [Phytophthora cactorum]|nr:hypothetical protein Pcac1_g11910 [Phytophthora cactorum]KAG4245896.1 hypothetical protein PC116_g6310 [Phytophthora cactorum]